MELEKNIVSRIATHREKDVEDLERHRVEDQVSRMRELKSEEKVEEVFLLQTCNRVEYHFLTSGEISFPFERDFEHLKGWNSIEHIIRVACGLESAVTGEDEILGQMKEARRDAEGAGLDGRMLEKTIEKAIQTGKKARRETGINEGKNSMASIAVAKASEMVEMRDSTAVVIGAGDMGSRIVENLETEETVCGTRNPCEKNISKNVKLLEVSEALERVPEADVLFTATSSSEYVVEEINLPEVVFDMGNPRDIDPDSVEEDRIFNLDDIEEMAESERRKRRREVERVEEIISEEMENLKKEYKHRKAEEAISKIQRKSHRLKEKQLEMLFNKLDPEDVEKVGGEIEEMADSLVNQLMAAPTVSLKRAAEEENWEDLDAALRIFGRGGIQQQSFEENSGEKVRESK